MTRPRFDRLLDDAEKNLLLRLAMYVVAEQTGADDQTAAEQRRRSA